MSRLVERLLPLTLEIAGRQRLYAERWSDVSTSSITTVTELGELPTIERRDIPAMEARAAPDDIVTSSSGTTGPPLVRSRSQEDVAFINDFFHPEVPQGPSIVVDSRQHGSILGLRAAGVCEVRDDGRGSAVDAVIRRLLDRHEAPIEVVIAALPFVRLLTHEMLERSIAPASCNLSLLVVTSDPVGRRRRDVLSTAWGCPVLERFSMSEVMGGATVCHQCGWMSFDPMVVPQVRSFDGGADVEEGVGRLVLTELWPFSSDRPLVRYLTDDVVLVRPGSCNGGECPSFRSLGRWTPHASKTWRDQGAFVSSTALVEALHDTDLLRVGDPPDVGPTLRGLWPMAGRTSFRQAGSGLCCHLEVAAAPGFHPPAIARLEQLVRSVPVFGVGAHIQPHLVDFGTLDEVPELGG